MVYLTAVLMNKIAYKSNRNVYYSCKYHIVWCPKYRRKVLVEDVAERLNKSIVDAGWALFQQFCTYKAANAGREVLLVNPKYTSQVCSGCGTVKKKERSDGAFRRVPEKPSASAVGSRHDTSRDYRKREAQ
jgi:transposase